MALRISKWLSIFTLHLRVCVCVCEWETATGLAASQAALLLRNFSAPAQTLTSKSQKPFGPKRSLPVGWRRTSVSGLCLDGISHGTWYLQNKSFTQHNFSVGEWFVVYAVAFLTCPMLFCLTCCSCDLWNTQSEKRICINIKILVAIFYFLFLKAHWFD